MELLTQEPRTIKLASMMIGNGMIDALHELPVILPPVCDGLDYPQVISDELCQAMRVKLPEGTRQTQRCYDSGLERDCMSAQLFWEDEIFEPYVFIVLLHCL